MKINTDISDLFFNTAMSDDINVRDDKGQFLHFDEQKLLLEAATFADTFERASGIKVHPHDLVTDFLERV